MGWGYSNPEGAGIPNLSGMETRFDISSPLGMGRVTSKYMAIRYGDGEGKICPYPIDMLNYVLDEINKRYMIEIMF